MATGIERWTIESSSRVDRTAIVVAGPMPLHGKQVRLVRESDYEALAEQLTGAVDRIKALRGNVAGLEHGDEREAPYARGYLAAVTDALERLVGQSGSQQSDAQSDTRTKG